MDTLSVLFSISATGCLLWGYWLYNRGIYKGTISPNVTTFFLWVIGGAVEAGSYWNITEDPLKRLFPIVCATVVVVTFFFALARGRFQKPKRIDILILVLDLELVLVMLTDYRPEYLMLMVQIDLILTFCPIWGSTWEKPEGEDPLPWMIWTLSYTLLTITVMLRFEDGWDLVYPILNIFLHALVGIIARFRTAAPSG
ncbi:hypothetical protein KBB85_06190 [Patescibacteria group bacterium]|nr:hypothetical protein [Patescibacteria group bacterium]